MNLAGLGPEALAEAVIAGERRALARAITLCESERAADFDAAERLLARLLPRAGGALRVGITGPPGAGKSTLIDALGLLVIAHGHAVAVLAVDPSSQKSGGSILGDKTRMTRLGAAPQSFIRPSPSGGASGGVTRHTREAVAICEAAGFGVVIVETVGVGQTEQAVADVVDVVALVLQPGAGDELQGMKRGILEVADVVVVNKADGAERERAERAAGELRGALSLFTRAVGGGAPSVLCASALSEQGVPELWGALEGARERARASGALDRRRKAGLRAWLEDEIKDGLASRVAGGEHAGERLHDLERLVEAGVLTPRRAARQFLESASG
ncbi:MAG TPA: methylmalonyl Co-A mutase-associated GTPase MeaB [Polyangiaceae bacterium]